MLFLGRSHLPFKGASDTHDQDENTFFFSKKLEWAVPENSEILPKTCEELLEAFQHCLRTKSRSILFP